MPLIEYLCSSCDRRQESLERSSDTAPDWRGCPRCGLPSPRVLTAPVLKRDGAYSYRQIKRIKR